jgi:hypothetical protein
VLYKHCVERFLPRPAKEAEHPARKN